MEKTYSYQPRELSWLSFNQRVLSEAADPTLQLYERINFLAIFSSNLDEFFRVKVAGLQNLLLLKASQIEAYTDDDPAELLSQIAVITLAQQEECGRILSTQLLPELEANGITLYGNQPLADEHVLQVRHYFRSQVLAYLQPVYLGSGLKTPFLINRQLYLAVRLQHKQEPQAGQSRLGYTYDWRSGPWMLRPSLTIAARDSRLNNYYYGVQPGEAIAGRPAYAPGAGINPFNPR